MQSEAVWSDPGGLRASGGDMAQEFSEGFYGSVAWKKCRAAYKKSVGGLCERCLTKGVYSAAAVVHHKIPITPENMGDPHIVLDWNNLEALCMDCHAEMHPDERKQGHEKRYGRPRSGSKRRWRVDRDGRVLPL